MKSSYEFLSQVLDSITAHIVVINELGEIQFVNKAWSTFGNNNACVIGDNWKGVNYINECDKASAMGDDFGTQAGAGIRRVIENKAENFYFEYPCHSPHEKRWFVMRVTSFSVESGCYFVITHQNITERKLAEQKVRDLARMDGLTNIPNRRTFDSVLAEQWKRFSRLKKPICIAMIDIDNFKLLNDTYGHQAGDECLINIAKVIQRFNKRPDDLCARYGGEEFVLIWGDTSLEQGKQLANKLLKAIVALNIDNKNSPTQSYLTASIGLAQMIPSRVNNETELISKADSMLYQAKAAGRNRVEC
mgnify:CR=1 FL=1